MRILERRGVQFIAVSAVEPKRIGTNLSDSPVCPKWVKRGPWRVPERCPLYSDQQTSPNASIRSETCHKRKWQAF
jgi:hypothetical protein